MINQLNPNTKYSRPSLHRENHIREIPRATFFIAVAALVLLGALMNLTEADLVISRVFANGQLGFPLRGNWIAERLLHYYAGKLTLLLALMIVIYNLKQLFHPSDNREVVIAGRYVLISWLVSFAIIGGLKQITTLPCPWNLTEFGGTSAYIMIGNAFSKSYSVGHCFPSGHATGAYGLVCLGFAMLVFNYSMKTALIPIFTLGALYGGAQLVRGAHFLSHDLFSIAISLTVAWIAAELYLWPVVARLRYGKAQYENALNLAWE